MRNIPKAMISIIKWTLEIVDIVSWGQAVRVHTLGYKTVDKKSRLLRDFFSEKKRDLAFSEFL